MSSIKCLSCGYRNPHSNVLRICTNCGAPLTPLPAEHEAPDTLGTPQQAQIAVGPPTESELSAETSRATRPSASTRAQQAAAQRTEMQPYQGSVPTRFSRQDLSPQPYQVAEPPAPADMDAGVNDEQFQTIIREAKDPRKTLPPRGKLPWGLPRRAPDITGTLIYVQAQTYHTPPPGLMNALSNQFEAIWSTPFERQQNRERERVITRMRIRGFNGEQWDAYLEGMLTGANVALGDDVSLWGHMRKGTLVTRRAYNHTTRSIVTSSATASQVPILIFLLIILAVVALWTLWTHFLSLPR